MMEEEEEEEIVANDTININEIPQLSSSSFILSTTATTINPLPVTEETDHSPNCQVSTNIVDIDGQAGEENIPQGDGQEDEEKIPERKRYSENGVDFGKRRAEMKEGNKAKVGYKEKRK